MGATARALIRGEDTGAHQHWQMADGLSRLGLQPGDKVATFGRGFHAYWAHLAQLKIVAELFDSAAFWAAEDSTRAEVTRVFATTGARILVTENVPSNFSGTGWQRVGETKYYVYRLAGD